ncbi:MAG: acetoacetate decarboxylase family protein [Nitrospirae bacterium]|nr:acetoacetate decarboxylase family protein [Nitrospirota bacterium]MBI5696683.1 acetoacetate decarboxylase family protein [Nitrospirota bacterium]
MQKPDAIASMQGLCMNVMYLIPSGKVRPLVPAPFAVSDVLPGFTIGGLYAARYATGDNTFKSEFGVLPAYVKYGERRGFFMSCFCQDETASCAGRGPWGLDKTPGVFSWDVSERAISLDVTTPGGPLAGIRLRPIVNRTPFGTTFPILCVKGESVVFFKNYLASNIGFATSSVHIPPESPLAGFPLGLKLVSTFWDASNVVVKAPELAHERALKGAEKALGSPIGKGM